MPSCTLISRAKIIPISFDPDNENNQAWPNFPYGNLACWGQQQTMLKSILTINPMMKYSKFEINI